jgi:excisionase family DNA binding protein
MKNETDNRSFPYTTPQAAKFLGLSGGTVIDYVRAGRLKATPVSEDVERTHFRYEKADLEEFLTKLEAAKLAKLAKQTALEQKRQARAVKQLQQLALQPSVTVPINGTHPQTDVLVKMAAQVAEIYAWVKG